MALIYKSCDQGIIPDYMCDPCQTGEKGRVRGVAFIHKSLLADLTKANLELKTWWETQIEAGLVKVIPATSGTYDGGAPNKTPGYGDVKETFVSKTHTVVYKDPNHTGNDEFYNTMERGATDYYMAWRTDTELRVGESTLQSLEAKDDTPDDVEGIVAWGVTAIWIQYGTKRNVSIYALGDVKDVFNCIDTTVVPAP